VDNVTVAPRGRVALTGLARGGTANLVGAAVTALCTFALTVALARGVSQVQAGVFFSTTSLFLVCTLVGQVGTQTGLVYFIARSRAAGGSAHSAGYLRVAVRPVLAVALTTAVAMFALARPLAELTAPNHVHAATTYYRVMAPFIPAVALEAALLAGTRGLGSMRAYTLIEQIARPVAQLALVAAATLTASSGVLALAWSITYVPAALAAWLAWRALRSREQVPETTALPPARSREFWRFTVPRALTSVVQMLMQRFDIVLVGAIAGATDAAIYAAATRFIVVGQLGTNALMMAAQPPLAARLSAGDHDAANELYRTSTGWLMLVTWPLYLTMILFGEPLLLVFGHGYTAGQTAMVIIACSMLVSTGLGIVDTVLSMAGRTSWNLANAAGALVINVVLDLILIPRHGIVGAAIGWAAAIVVRNVAAVLQISLRVGPHPFARPAFVAAALNATCYFGIMAAVRAQTGATPFGLVLGVAIATAAYVPGLWLLRRPLRLDALVGPPRGTS
jgi:O-antigen/teichoic acid export membrane protein